MKTYYCPRAHERTQEPCRCTPAEKHRVLVSMMQRKMPKDENGKPVLRIVEKRNHA